MTRRVVLSMIKRRAAAAGAPALDLLPHVPGDGDHGVSIDRGDPRALSRSPGTGRPRRRRCTIGRADTVTVDEIERIVILERQRQKRPRNERDMNVFAEHALEGPARRRRVRPPDRQSALTAQGQDAPSGRRAGRARLGRGRSAWRAGHAPHPPKTSRGRAGGPESSRRFPPCSRGPRNRHLLQLATRGGAYLAEKPPWVVW